MFLDQVTIQVQGGNGGNGCVAWRREKYVAYGGPDGGDGGRGGDTVALADPNTDTLSDFASRKKFAAKFGENGSGKCCAGADAEDLVLRVPPGTLIYELQPDGTEVLLADLSLSMDRKVLARGGRGGFGNAHFTSSTRQAPDFAELGEPGEQKKIRFELKLVADIGIIGYPSVGKSSLIAAVSRARPKIADYPFTTLVPNLGVVHLFDREFVLCDVPGLIEGASEGKGLGHQFLKHIERCGILIHLLDVSRDDIVADYKVIRRELKAHSPALAKKKEVIVLNKVDLVDGDAKPWLDALKKAKIPVFATISAAARTGTEDLMKKLFPLVLKAKEDRAVEEVEREATELPVLRPLRTSEKMNAYRIEREGTKLILRGKRLEQFTIMTDFTNPSGRNRFCDVLQRTGILKALEKILQPDDEIYVGTKNVTKWIR